MTQLSRRRIMLDIIKGLDLDGHDLEALVEYAAFTDLFVSQFEKNSLEVPSWLKEKRESLESTIKSKRRDAVVAALKSAEAKFDSLKSAEDKRKDLQDEITRLKSLL